MFSVRPKFLRDPKNIKKKNNNRKIEMTMICRKSNLDGFFSDNTAENIQLMEFQELEWASQLMPMASWMKWRFAGDYKTSQKSNNFIIEDKKIFSNYWRWIMYNRCDWKKHLNMMKVVVGGYYNNEWMNEWIYLTKAMPIETSQSFQLSLTVEVNFPRNSTIIA